VIVVVAPATNVSASDATVDLAADASASAADAAGGRRVTAPIVEDSTIAMATSSVSGRRVDAPRTTFDVVLEPITRYPLMSLLDVPTGTA
jgi:hypothetical protein